MKAPLIWALTGRNAGDNAQVRALAADAAKAVGGTVVDLPLQFNRLREVPNAWLGRSLLSLKGTRPTAPWPDLVIGIGRRAVPVARWIQRQSSARLVWLGRPRISTDVFDLVLTTPQYGVPHGANIVLLSLPYGAATEPSEPVAPLMLVGGDSWSNSLDQATVERLISCAERVAPNGLRVTTSPRTPPAVADQLARHLPTATVHRFTATGSNPYEAWLKEASLCIVTGDSVSLLADAVQTNAPTYVVRASPSPLLRKLSGIAPGTTQKWLSNGGNRALLSPPPNVDAVFRRFVQKGAAKTTPEGIAISNLGRMIVGERSHALNRVIALLR